MSRPRPSRGGTAPDAVVVTPPASIRRRHDLRFTGLFVVFALPVGAVVWAIIGPWLALAYVVAQTAFLSYGLRRRHVPTLRMDEVGLSYEPGRFQLRCEWADVSGVTRATLPSGPVEALTLARPRLHWAGDARIRAEVHDHGWDQLVPVGEFDPDWRHGPIGAALARWAPDVLLDDSAA